MRSGRVTILQVNDTHGYLEPHPELVWQGTSAAYPALGGYAKMAGYCRDVRKECGGAVVLLDNGDTFHGTYPVVRSKGECLLPLLGAMGFDAMTGHWDFAYGPAHLKSLVSRLPYPFLAINCYDKETGDLTFPPTRVVERGGLRIGIIGVAATIVDKTMPPQFSTGIEFTLGNLELPDHIRRLREHEDVDLVVVLSHLGFPQDVKLAGEVEGIDVLVSGHTHNRLTRPFVVGATSIIQSGCHGSFMGRLDVSVDAGKVTVTNHELVAMDRSIVPDSAMQAMVDGILAPHRPMLGERIGKTDVALNRNTMAETTMDNLLLDAVAEAAGTAIAFSNGWRYGAPVPVGDITAGDLWNIIPGNPPVSTVELSGRELLAMMEENLERTFGLDAYEQMGGYIKRCRGITLRVKLENPMGGRVEKLFVGECPVEADGTYMVAFVTQQGVPVKYGRNRRDLNVRAVEALTAHVRQLGRVSPRLTGSVVAV
jgi:sulfur-oxidizing protein SoxB